jgi:hypothetical protein
MDGNEETTMRLTHLGFAVLLLGVFCLISGAGGSGALPAAEKSAAARPLVIVELFTSEGCSSCPPADELLKKLSAEQPIPEAEVVALEEHVDYWNQLGWKDPYSSSEFSLRQQAYASLFRNGGPYTPQMVVDGQAEFVGSRAREAWETIQRAASKPKADVQLKETGTAGKGAATFEVRVEHLPASSSGEAELWVAVTEGGLETQVTAGENSGERLQHAAVVRALRKIDRIRGDANQRVTLRLEETWRRGNLAVVAFVVEKNSRKIVGAGIVHPGKI